MAGPQPERSDHQHHGPDGQAVLQWLAGKQQQAPCLQQQRAHEQGVAQQAHEFQLGMGADDKVQERSATEQGEPGPVQGRATHILEQPARRQPSQGNHQLLEKRHGQADLRGLPVVQGGHVRDGRSEWDSGAAEYRQSCRAQET